MVNENSLDIVIKAEKLLQELGFHVCLGSSYLEVNKGTRYKIATIIFQKNGNIQDAAKEIINRAHIDEKWLYL